MPKFLLSNTLSFTGATRAVAVLAVMSLTMVGCGGAAEPPAAEQPAAEAPAAQPAAAPPAASGPAFVSITPDALIQIYVDNDEYQANEMAGAYLGRMLKVDAVVTSVVVNPDGVVVVTSTGPVAAPNAGTSLRLLFPKAAESSVSALTGGAKIQAGCSITKVDKTKIELADCALL